MANINRAPGGKGALASTGNYSVDNDVDNKDVGTENLLNTTKDKISDLYEGVEQQAGDLKNKLENQLPESVKDYSLVLMALLPILSFVLIGWGLYRLLRPREINFHRTE
jgi:hypothetical protein